jgi:hypothetical protein
MREAMTDNDLSPQIAARLIAEQFPELAPKRVRLQAALGTDNHIFRTGDDRCARFVKVSSAAEAAHRQVAALPRFSGAPLSVRSAKFKDAPARLPDADRAGQRAFGLRPCGRSPPARRSGCTAMCIREMS